jgi:NADPH-dependent 2,4-dienoyl-CoA reductase/sulfur reductase-like enzyme
MTSAAPAAATDRSGTDGRPLPGHARVVVVGSGFAGIATAVATSV